MTQYREDETDRGVNGQEECAWPRSERQTAKWVRGRGGVRNAPNAVAVAGDNKRWRRTVMVMVMVMVMVLDGAAFGLSERRRRLAGSTKRPNRGLVGRAGSQLRRELTNEDVQLPTSASHCAGT